MEPEVMWSAEVFIKNSAYQQGGPAEYHLFTNANRFFVSLDVVFRTEFHLCACQTKEFTNNFL